MATKKRSARRGFWTSWKGVALITGAVGLVVASLFLPAAFRSENADTSHGDVAMGAGLPVGTVVPRFSETDLQTGRQITSDGVGAGKTLLFFSEGIMCQACFEQIRGLERLGAELQKRGIRLVSVTPDSPEELRAATRQYGIRTPMISDSDRDMSEAFNVLGQGMHGDTPGHAFALVENGKVAWYRDYWPEPYRTMYVDPSQVIVSLPTSGL